MPTSPIYDVVSPVGKHISETIRSVEPLPDLEGKKIGFVWISFTNGDVLTDALIGLLGKRLRGSEFVKLPSGEGLEWGEVPTETVGAMARQAGVDAVIVTVGG